jgi:hypothetical protein
MLIKYYRYGPFLSMQKCLSAFLEKFLRFSGCPAYNPQYPDLSGSGFLLNRATDNAHRAAIHFAAFWSAQAPALRTNPRPELLPDNP